MIYAVQRSYWYYDGGDNGHQYREVIVAGSHDKAKAEAEVKRLNEVKSQDDLADRASYDLVELREL